MVAWLVNPNTGYTTMKHLLIGTMAVAVLAISGSVLAQPAPSMAQPGTNATPPAASDGAYGLRDARSSPAPCRPVGQE
jgi:hypothetical protein